MSSATSIEDRGTHPTARHPEADPGLRPWQFFLLAGMLSATAVVLIVTGQSPASIVVLSLTVVAASLVALGAYLAFVPLVLPEHTEVPQVAGGRVRAALEREKALVLRSIKELEFDYAMKKVGKADFDDMSARLRARAIGLMRQLDEGVGYRDEIERELRSRLGAVHEGPSFSSGNVLATDSAEPVEAKSHGVDDARADQPPPRLRRSAEALAKAEARALMRCSCGTLNDHDARFCKACGARLATS